MEFLATNFAPIMFAGLIIFLLLGFPVAFSLGACGLFFGFIGIPAADDLSRRRGRNGGRYGRQDHVRGHARRARRANV